MIIRLIGGRLIRGVPYATTSRRNPGKTLLLPEGLLAYRQLVNAGPRGSRVRMDAERLRCSAVTAACVHVFPGAVLNAGTRCAVVQSEYNMLKRGVEREVLPYCRTHNVGFVPYYPLAGGFLTGKYEMGKPPPAGSRGESVRNVQELMTEKNYHRVGKLTAWANDHGRGVNELAQAWLLAQPSVCSVITGANKLKHLTSTVKAAVWS